MDNKNKKKELPESVIIVDGFSDDSLKRKQQIEILIRRRNEIIENINSNNTNNGSIGPK